VALQLVCGVLTVAAIAGILTSAARLGARPTSSTASGGGSSSSSSLLLAASLGQQPLPQPRGVDAWARPVNDVPTIKLLAAPAPPCPLPPGARRVGINGRWGEVLQGRRPRQWSASSGRPAVVGQQWSASSDLSAAVSQQSRVSTELRCLPQTPHPGPGPPAGVPAISKIIHQSWKTSDLPERFRPLQRSWRELAPTWEYLL
jgi:hypothetical protein